MDDITREKLLKIALVAVGAIFFTIYPLSLIWPSGWQWHGGHGQYYFQMICGIYAVLGAYLVVARPAHAWTLEELASQAAASRSALADRFTEIVGCPPIQYLTQWRMQIAAKRLADPGVKVATVAHDVGYESEAAFSRAFKKFVGRSPSQWRTGSI
jgi:AraC-like DNA-binding protein